MSEPVAKRQMFGKYDGDNPVSISIIFPDYPLSSDELLFNHWHEELEIVYTLQGNSLHYIDGTCIKSQPGRLIVVNSVKAVIISYRTARYMEAEEKW